MPSVRCDRSVSLKDVLPHGHFFGSPDIRVSACCSEAGACQPGDLFIALERADRDGHAEFQTAIRRGAQAILAEQYLPVDVPLCVAADTREAHGRLCQALAGQPTATLRTIGISGTNGKTVTARLLASIFKAAKQPTGRLDSIDYSDGFESAVAERATPTAPELADWLHRIAANDCRNAVLELSSRALAQRHTAGVELDVAILTNLRRDHLRFHGGLIQYRQANARLFSHLKPGGVAIVNADDAPSRFALPRQDRPIITFSMQRSADVTGRIVERQAGEQTFLLTAGWQTVAVQTRQFGEAHVYNCLAAAAAGLAAGLDLTVIARGLENCPTIPGRMEPIMCGQPFGVYVDAARTPDALAAALKSLKQVTTGRVLCVYGADSRGDKEHRPLLGRAVERHAHLGVITNNNPRREEPLQIAHDILDGYDRPGRDHILPTRAEAIRWMLSQAQPNDAVLIAGQGERSHEIIGSRKQAHDDRETARQWLAETGARIEYESPRATILPFRSAVAMAN